MKIKAWYYDGEEYHKVDVLEVYILAHEKFAKVFYYDHEIKVRLYELYPRNKEMNVIAKRHNKLYEELEKLDLARVDQGLTLEKDLLAEAKKL